MEITISEQVKVILQQLATIGLNWHWEITGKLLEKTQLIDWY